MKMKQLFFIIFMISLAFLAGCKKTPTSATIEDTTWGVHYYSVEEGMLVGRGTFTSRVGHYVYYESGSLELANPTIMYTPDFTKEDCTAIGGEISKNDRIDGCKVYTVQDCVLVKGEVTAPQGIDASIGSDTHLQLWTVSMVNPSVNYDAYVSVGVKVIFDCPLVKQRFPSFYCIDGDTCVYSSMMKTQCFASMDECNVVLQPPIPPTPPVVYYCINPVTGSDIIGQRENECVNSTILTTNCYSSLEDCENSLPPPPKTYYCSNDFKCIMSSVMGTRCYSTVDECSSKVKEQKMFLLGASIVLVIILFCCWYFLFNKKLLGGRRK